LTRISTKYYTRRIRKKKATKELDKSRNIMILLRRKQGQPQKNEYNNG